MTTKKEMTKENLNQERRDLFSKGLVSAAALMLAPGFLNKAFAGEDPNCKDHPVYVIPGKDMAASLKYTETLASVEKALQIERQGVPFAKQSCKTCGVYTADPLAKNKYGKCAIFAGPCQVVKDSAWCSAWSKGKNI